MVADQVLDLLQFLILLAKLLQQHPRVDLLLQLIHKALVVIDDASLMQEVMSDVEQAVYFEWRFGWDDVVQARLVLHVSVSVHFILQRCRMMMVMMHNFRS